MALTVASSTPMHSNGPISNIIVHSTAGFANFDGPGTRGAFPFHVTFNLNAAVGSMRIRTYGVSDTLFDIRVECLHANGATTTILSSTMSLSGSEAFYTLSSSCSGPQVRVKWPSAAVDWGPVIYWIKMYSSCP